MKMHRIGQGHCGQKVSRICNINHCWHQYLASIDWLFHTWQLCWSLERKNQISFLVMLPVHMMISTSHSCGYPLLFTTLDVEVNTRTCIKFKCIFLLILWFVSSFDFNVIVVFLHLKYIPFYLCCLLTGYYLERKKHRTFKI